MPTFFVEGDPLLTRAPLLCFGHNARGRFEGGALPARLMQDHPAAFAAYGKQCRAGRIRPGDLWIWREHTPMLGFIAARLTAAGAVRYRHVEAAALRLARDHHLLGVTAVAIAPLAEGAEWAALLPALDFYLRAAPLPCILYTRLLPGVKGEAGLTLP